MYYLIGVMSFTERHENNASSREEWVNKLEGLTIKRTDMNKLIMNYLVTGMYVLVTEPFVVSGD